MALAMGRGLRRLGVGLLGFGDIGASVAHALRARGAEVAIYDTDPVRTVAGHMQGYKCMDRTELVCRAPVIVGASGRRSLTKEDLPELADGVILASASSRAVEFPVAEIGSASTGRAQAPADLTEYSMLWGKRVLLANDGHPVNFRDGSLPVPVADLMLASLAACIARLATTELAPGIHALPEDDERAIAQLWLDAYGSTPFAADILR